MAEHNELGLWGEDEAARYLEEKGYLILDRQWRNGKSKRDIDIICRTPDKRTVVFVEVKTRGSKEMVDPVEAVDRKKALHLRSAAHAYVQLNQVVEELRFDIITIVGRRNGQHNEINHLENAFNPLLL